jgi:hypothetical protein
LETYVGSIILSIITIITTSLVVIRLSGGVTYKTPLARNNRAATGSGITNIGRLVAGLAGQTWITSRYTATAIASLDAITEETVVTIAIDRAFAAGFTTIARLVASFTPTARITGMNTTTSAQTAIGTIAVEIVLTSCVVVDIHASLIVAAIIGADIVIIAFCISSTFSNLLLEHTFGFVLQLVPSVTKAQGGVLWGDCTKSMARAIHFLTDAFVG